MHPSMSLSQASTTSSASRSGTSSIGPLTAKQQGVYLCTWFNLDHPGQSFPNSPLASIGRIWHGTACTVDGMPLVLVAVLKAAEFFLPASSVGARNCRCWTRIQSLTSSGPFAVAKKHPEMTYGVNMQPCPSLRASMNRADWRMNSCLVSIMAFGWVKTSLCVGTYT